MRDQKRVCADCGAQLQFGSGCYFCPECGWGKCGRAVDHVVAFTVMMMVLAVAVTL